MKPLIKNSIFLVGHYVLGLVFFFIFRIILFFTQKDIDAISTDWSFVKRSFGIGFQFDSVVMAYILVLPLLLLLSAVFLKNTKQLYKTVWIVLNLLVLLAFAISFIDIPYFKYNFSRVSVVIFSWFSDFDIVAGMVLGEFTYAIYFVIFIINFLIFRFLSKKIFDVTLHFDKNIDTKFHKLFFSLGMLVMTFLLFLCLRGRVDSPIRINHAFFCNNSFYNQLGLNPNFTLIKSLKQNNAIKVMDDNLALELAKKYLKVNEALNNNNPIARFVKSDSVVIEKNIVLVIMESMTADKMGCFGNPDNLTPFLDSLSKQSLFFRNIYSAGRHTCNGNFSTLYSYPSILRERPMSSLEKTKYSSLPEVFKNNNYTNVYSVTHSETFDNIGEFLPANDFDSIVSQKCYNPNYVQSSFGVPDHVFFKYGIETANYLHKNKKKFFSAMMTISDHGPYIIPENIDFKSEHTDIKKQIVQYADWSIKQFVQSAKQTDWYKETIFVFVADHGAVNDNHIYELPLSLHHIPLIIFSPDTNLCKPHVFETFGMQMDVLPSIADLLNISYLNNTYGSSILKETKKYAFFSSDDKLACIGKNYYYVYKVDGSEALYEYKNRNQENLASKLIYKTKEMRDYVLSMTQSAKWIIDHKKTEIK